MVPQEIFFSDRPKAPDLEWYGGRQRIQRVFEGRRGYAVQLAAYHAALQTDVRDLLQNVGDADKAAVEKAYITLRRKGRRNDAAVKMDAYAYIPTRKSPIARIALGREEARQLPDPQVLVTEMDRRDKPGRVYLPPGVLYAYEVIADPGLGWPELLPAVMMHRAVAVADWIVPSGRRGYIQISVLNDAALD